MHGEPIKRRRLWRTVVRIKDDPVPCRRNRRQCAPIHHIGGNLDIVLVRGNAIPSEIGLGAVKGTGRETARRVPQAHRHVGRAGGSAAGEAIADGVGECIGAGKTARRRVGDIAAAQRNRAALRAGTVHAGDRQRVAIRVIIQTRQGGGADFKVVGVHQCCEVVRAADWRTIDLECAGGRARQRTVAGRERVRAGRCRLEVAERRHAVDRRHRQRAVGSK